MKSIFKKPFFQLESSFLFFFPPSVFSPHGALYFWATVLGRVTAHFPPLSNAFADKAYCSRVSLISIKKSESFPMGKVLL